VNLVRLAPNTFVSRTSEFAPAILWDLISNPLILPNFSSELQHVRLLGSGTVNVGSRFEGDQIRGERHWTTTSTVTQCVAPEIFEWTVGDVDCPVSRWSFLLDSCRDVTTLTHRVQLCGGPSPLSTYIEEHPDEASDVIQQRLDDLRERMSTTVKGLLALAGNSNS
jgi:hypothetical protein